MRIKKEPPLIGKDDIKKIEKYFLIIIKIIVQYKK